MTTKLTVALVYAQTPTILSNKDSAWNALITVLSVWAWLIALWEIAQIQDNMTLVLTNAYANPNMLKAEVVNAIFVLKR